MLAKNSVEWTEVQWLQCYGPKVPYITDVSSEWEGGGHSSFELKKLSNDSFWNFQHVLGTMDDY